MKPPPEVSQFVGLLRISVVIILVLGVATSPVWLAVLSFVYWVGGL